MANRRDWLSLRSLSILVCTEWERERDMCIVPWSPGGEGTGSRLAKIRRQKTNTRVKINFSCQVVNN